MEEPILCNISSMSFVGQVFSLFAQLIQLYLSGSSGVCLIMILQQGKLKTGGENCKVTENEDRDLLD